MNLLTIMKEYTRDRPKIKKATGIMLILIGLTALFTPLTPGSWLIFIGAELLGARLLFQEKLTLWWKKLRRKKMTVNNPHDKIYKV